MSKSILWAALAAAVVTAGCTGDVGSPDSGGLVETAETSIIAGGPEMIYATLNIANNSGLAQDLSWTYGCNGLGAIRIRAYRGDASRTLVWDSARLAQMQTVMCPAAMVLRTLNPGDITAIHETVAASTILGDSLAPGQYVLTLQAATTPALSLELSTPALTIINAVVDPPGVNLNGTWQGAAHGVSVALSLTWSADSVKGTGTYTAADDNSLGCGGGSLRGSGTVTLVAARSPGQFAGYTTFSGGWTPPFRGVVTDANTIAGSFMSVDVGPCPLTLTRAP